MVKYLTMWGTVVMHLLFQTTSCDEVYPHFQTAMHKDTLISATETFHLSTEWLIALLKGTLTLGSEKGRTSLVHSPL